MNNSINHFLKKIDNPIEAEHQNKLIKFKGLSQPIKLNLGQWLSIDQFISYFNNIKDPNLVDGDIYIKFF